MLFNDFYTRITQHTKNRANNWILIERHCIKLNHANIFLPFYSFKRRVGEHGYEAIEKKISFDRKNVTRIFLVARHLIVGNFWNLLVIIFARICRHFSFIDICHFCLIFYHNFVWWISQGNVIKLEMSSENFSWKSVENLWSVQIKDDSIRIEIV